MGRLFCIAETDSYECLNILQSLRSHNFTTQITVPGAAWKSSGTLGFGGSLVGDCQTPVESKVFDPYGLYLPHQTNQPEHKTLDPVNCVLAAPRFIIAYMTAQKLSLRFERQPVCECMELHKMS